VSTPAINPNQALWEKGDFTRIAATMRESGADLVKRIGITKELKVLDLACGDGTTALPSALGAAASFDPAVTAAYGDLIGTEMNNLALHDQIESAFKTAFPKAKAMKIPNLITFFGNRKGMPDEQAIDNCVTGLNRIKGMAEDHGVTVVP